MNENKMMPMISHMKKGGKLWIILALLGAGVVLLVVGNSNVFKSARGIEEECVHEEKLDIEDYEMKLEDDISRFCLGISGAEQVVASVRLSGSSQSVYAKNYQNGTGSYREEYVILGSGSGATLVYLGEESPEILGVGVIISGNYVNATKNEIEALISAAYGVPLSRIYVKILGG